MTEPSPPKITFPCPYPIKVMGMAGSEFHEHVMTVMARHATDFSSKQVEIRDSRNGRYQSLRITITATGEKQLKAIFEDLKTSPLVQMVL